MDKDSFPVGKLPLSLLERLLGNIRRDDPNVLAGPGIGVDAAVVRFGDSTLVFKTDPITFTSENLPWYLVTINSNDIACMGGTPRYLLVTFLLPEGKTTPSFVETLFSELEEACSAYEIILIGGHTEITTGLDRPLAIGFMIGTIESGDNIRPSAARPGNLVLLSKCIPIEATAIIMTEVGEEIGLDQEIIQKGRGLIRDPGISILKEARLALDSGGVTAMHDPTEGGLATGLKELAMASGCGIEVYRDCIPVLDFAEGILSRFGVDPLGALSSGSLVVCCEEKSAPGILDAWAKNSIRGAVIGRLTESRDMILVENGASRPLPEFSADEITRIFSRKTS